MARMFLPQRLEAVTIGRIALGYALGLVSYWQWNLRCRFFYI